MKLFSKLNPIVDKIDYILDIRTRSDGFNLLTTKLKESFGDSKQIVNTNKGIWGYKYEYGLFVVEPNEHGYCRIEIHPYKIDLSKLEEVLSLFPTEFGPKYMEKRSQNIINIELAFDVNPGISDQETQEKVTESIAKYLRPKFIQSVIFNCISGENLECSDGAINGKCTYYFNSKKRKEHVASNKYTNRGSSAKVYTKKLAESTWCTRCEAKLNKNYSIKLIRKFNVKIFQLSKLIRFIENKVLFNDYFDFEVVYRKKFIDEVPNYIEDDNKILQRLKKRIKKFNVSAYKKSVMKAIAKIPPTRTLANKISRKFVKARSNRFIENKIAEICGQGS